MSYKYLTSIIAGFYITIIANGHATDDNSVKDIIAFPESTTVEAQKSVVLNVYFLNWYGKMIDVPIGPEGSKLLKNTYRVEGSIYTENEGSLYKSGDFLSVKSDLGNKGKIINNKGIKGIKLEFLPLKKAPVDKSKKIGIYSVFINVDGTHMKSNDFLIYFK